MGELVLIVDDDERNAKLARDVLRGGCRAANALRRDGAPRRSRACSRASSRTMLVLLDLRLPDLDGVEVARRLAASEPTAHTPVVALSAEPAAGTGDWIREAGFAAYIEKPIDVRAFPQQVRQYLSGG